MKPAVILLGLFLASASVGALWWLRSFDGSPTREGPPEVDAGEPAREGRRVPAISMDDRWVLGRLREEARALAAAGPDRTQAALAAYTKVEDAADDMLDKARRAKDEDAKAYFTTQCKEIIAESNEFVARVFTRRQIEETSWTDLLAPDQRDDWQQYGLEGFRLGDGRLEVAGPGPRASAHGLFAFPATGGYRDFEMEMDFSLEGVVDLLFRLGPRVDNTVEYCRLRNDGDEPLNPTLVYTLRVSYIGERLRGRLTPEAFEFPSVDSSWNKSRKGALGFQVFEGAKLTITKLRVRVLRGA